MTIVFVGIDLAKNVFAEQGLALAGIAVEDLVVDGQAVGRLRHAEQELPGHHALLGHAEVTGVGERGACRDSGDRPPLLWV